MKMKNQKQKSFRLSTGASIFIGAVATLIILGAAVFFLAPIGGHDDPTQNHFTGDIGGSGDSGLEYSDPEPTETAEPDGEPGLIISGLSDDETEIIGTAENTNQDEVFAILYDPAENRWWDGDNWVYVQYEILPTVDKNGDWSFPAPTSDSNGWELTVVARDKYGDSETVTKIF